MTAEHPGPQTSDCDQMTPCWTLSRGVLLLVMSNFTVITVYSPRGAHFDILSHGDGKCLKKGRHGECVSGTSECLGQSIHRSVSGSGDLCRLEWGNTAAIDGQ